MSTSVTPHEVEHLRKRVALYILIMLLIDLGAWVSDVVSPLLVDDLVYPVLPPFADALRMAATPFMAICWAIARFTRPGLRALIFFEGAVTLILVVVYAEIGAAYEPDFGPALAILGLIQLLFVRAALVPSPATRTIVVGILGAGSFLFAVDEEITALGPVMRDGLTFMCIATVAITAVNSRVIYGLRREVRKALQLGQYTLEKKLGEGGMGAVYRARHSMLRRQAAIKLIKPEVSGEGSQRTQALERFEREAQATADLKSPHTIQLYDFGVSAEGAFYYVMELLDGVDLDTAVEKYGPMPPERVVFLLRQACESLEEAHAADFVHRDIKPANIFLCHHGLRYDFVKLLDFGLVTLGQEQAKSDAKLTADGTAIGTPAYLAPEMVTGTDTVDGRADIYALGCVAYWLLTGHPPFERETAMATILAHAKDRPVPPSRASELTIPEALEALVLDCLEKDPADRPGSASELSRRLAAALSDEAWDQERAERWWQTHKPERAESSTSAAGEPSAKLTKAFD